MANVGGSAESYIGSLISLTSKSEIRYEGRLNTINTENSNITLQDVTSFGTEGRKKDGPQIPPSDKVYDYIVFRASDIRDLQVKSSPQVKTVVRAHNDPAIVSLQPEHPQPASLSPPFLQPPLGNSVVNNPSSYSNISVAALHNAVPSFYQPAGLVSWGVPPSPGVNGNLAMPMYWQGYYRPAAGISPLQQPPPTSLRPPTLSTSQFSQTQLPQASAHLGISAVLPSSVTSSAATQPLPNIPDMSFTDSHITVSVPPNLSTASLSSPLSSLTAASMLAAVNPSLNTADSLPSSQHVNTIINPTTKIVNPAALSSQSLSKAAASLPEQITLVSPALLKPAQLFHPGMLPAITKSSTATAEPVISEQNILEFSNTAASSIPTLSVPQPQEAMTQPLLPLPTATSVQNQYSQANRFLGNTDTLRGRGRGRRRGIRRGSGYWEIAHRTHQFTEDFDFTAMNEKFKKDEVWGELGKGEYIGVDEEQDGVEDAHDEDVSIDLQSSRVLDMPRKLIYVKDDFF
eukprot:c28645_g3_i1 orf=2-1546(-)